MDGPLTFEAWNLSAAPRDDDLLFKCWVHFNCETCLDAPYPCSWCPTSSTCVPNTLMPHPLAILSPIKSENICPLSWRERWEMRAKPFSCRCSTMTFMSVVVAVLATLTWVLLVHLLTILVRWSVRRWRRRSPDWWRVHEAPWWGLGKGKWRWRRRVQVQDDAGTQTHDEERTPLLS